MKMIGIIVGVAGAILVVWHSVNVVMGRDQDGSGFGNHRIMSLVGGILVFVGIWIYTVGRKRSRAAGDT